MMRSAASQSLLTRSFVHSSKATLPSTHRSAYHLSKSSFRQHAFTGKTVKPLALTSLRATTSVIRYYATTTVPGSTQNVAREQKLGQQVLKADPSAVSTTSTIPDMIASARPHEEEDVDMMAGIRHDMKVIKDTFALDEVPKEALRLGLAGVIPYLATSTATVVCAFELNEAAAHGGHGFLMNADMASTFLQVLEPIQVGYGAVILSFLGAIHWGLEWAGYGGHQGYRRYAIGVVAPAVAWPTLLLPVEYALITQFLAFTVFYTVDSSATWRGWVPPWYSTYRFVLTFVVGAAIVVSLVGRGQVMERIGQAPTATQRVAELRHMAFDEKNKESEDEE